jgi:simple sugar transport system ATP-binding protein
MIEVYINIMKCLELKNITKIFSGGVIANNHINFDLEKGEIHILFGENGAGKSTLMKILSGLYKSTSGQIFINGKEIEINSPKDSINNGVGMVYQEFMLIPQLSVAENIILGMNQKHGIFMDIKDASEKILEFASRYKIEIDPYARVGELAVGQQQRVEIVKVLFRGAKILILDEPTSVLTPQEVDKLFSMIRELVKMGHSVIFISHKIDEIKTIGDRITVLRKGKSIGTVSNDISKNELVKMMLGKEITLEVNKPPAKMGGVVLRLEGIDTFKNNGIKVLKNIFLEIREGEVLGIAGIDGNGQAELAEVIIGLRKVVKGKIILSDFDITNAYPREIIKHRVGYIPGDRHTSGLIFDMDLKENIILKDYNIPPHSKSRFLDWDFIKEHTRKLIRGYDIRTTSEEVLAKNLSGGNQQKLILARELHQELSLLIALYPTRGLDVGACEFVHKRIIEERSKGLAVLYVSNEIEEIMNISDRIAVICGGEIMGIVRPEEVSIEELGLMMAGTKKENISI